MFGVRGKGGKIFAFFLVIAVIAILGLTLWLFLTQKNIAEQQLALPLKLSTLYEQDGAHDYYVKKAVKSSVEAAYSRLLENLDFIDEGCMIEGSYTEFCAVADTRQKFLFYAKEKLNGMEKPVNCSIALKDSIVRANCSYPEFAVTDGFVASYKRPKQEFTIELAALGIDLDFWQLLEEARECVKRECAFEHFEAEKRHEAGKIFFELKTKRPFVIDGKAKRLKTAFYLKI